jgi:hypothetical protein
MNNDAASEPAPKWIVYLSAAGSVASIVALSIVLIQGAAETRQIPAEYMVWRFVFAATALVASGGIAVYTYLNCRSLYLCELPHQKKVLRICFAIMAGLIAVGICLDGLFAALYWSPWMWIIVRFLR